MAPTPADLKVTQTGLDRWSFTDRESGVEYRRVDVDPLFGNDVSHISAFTIDAAGKVHFLRRRAVDAEVVSG